MKDILTEAIKSYPRNTKMFKKGISPKTCIRQIYSIIYSAETSYATYINLRYCMSNIQKLYKGKVRKDMIQIACECYNKRNAKISEKEKDNV